MIADKRCGDGETVVIPINKIGKIFINTNTINMPIGKRVSAVQLRKYFKYSKKDGFVPSTQAIYILLNLHGLKPTKNHNTWWYDSYSAWQVINQNMRELRQINDRLEAEEREEMEMVTPKPHTHTYGDDLPPESVELLKKDGVWYESAIRKAALECLNELKLYQIQPNKNRNVNKQ